MKLFSIWIILTLTMVLGISAAGEQYVDVIPQSNRNGLSDFGGTTADGALGADYYL